MLTPMRESNPMLIGMLVSTLPIVWLLSGKKFQFVPAAGLAPAPHLATSAWCRVGLLCPTYRWRVPLYSRQSSVYRLCPLALQCPHIVLSLKKGEAIPIAFPEAFHLPQLNAMSAIVKFQR